MGFLVRIAMWLAALLPCLHLASPAQETEVRTEVPIPGGVDLTRSFSLRLCVRFAGSPPQDLPAIATNKAWESGEVRDYTTNNAYGIGRESGSLPGFAISVLADGAWTWNAGDGNTRLDHRPEAADQGIADGAWHEIGFSMDQEQGVAHLFHDGERVAIYDLQGLGHVAGDTATLRLGSVPGLEVADVRLEAEVLSPNAVATSFEERFGRERRPKGRARWDGDPLRVLAWNIWHGGRRKGRDEGVRRVVDVIRDCDADLVLMQETYGSGPRISGRLDYDFYLRSSNLSILSRYPIRDIHRLYQAFRFGGATIELRPGEEIQAYSLWIHYLPDVGEALERGATAEELVRAEQETRGSEIAEILRELSDHLDAAPTVPVLIGGDFNSGSHLDWTAAAAELPDHYGLTVPWPVSLAMQRAGFLDTFRSAHPDPLASRGHTWSPEFPESHQDRIDYVYASRGHWQVVESRVLREHPRGWPSDHAAVLSTLELVEPPTPLKVMSYNIHYGVGMDEKRDLERIAGIITAEAPDLVGLQEIGSKKMAEELAERTGMAAVFGPSKGSDDSYGDAILSKHPFTWVGNAALPSASSSRYQAMAIDADLSALYGEGATVRFINTHFDWTTSIGSQEARRASVQVIERALCDELPTLSLLAGDLNAVPGSTPLQELKQAGWHLPLPGRPLETYGAPDPTKQIDYVLVRPRSSWRIVDVRVLDEPVASDHYPIVLTAWPTR